MAGEIKGDEIELVGSGSVDKQLLYVGRRSISKYGCSGCHDVPGYEDAKPIGTGLADWGRKGADKLAFEQIAQYILRGHGHESKGDKAADATLVPETVDLHDAAYVGPQTEEGMSQDVELIHAEGGHELDFKDLPPSLGYFMKKLFGHEREGFIWQKLRALRSYDYKKTENKGYNERLRMPQFNLGPVEREQVITFVLGLVAEPPAPQYIYKPTPRRSAIGRRLEGHRQVQLQRLPRLPDGPLGPGLLAWRFCRSAQVQRLRLPRRALHAAANRRVGKARQQRPAARHTGRHADVRREDRQAGARR